MTETDFPATSIYLTPAARRRQFAVFGGCVAVLTALAALSYFSGDRYNTVYFLFVAADLYFVYRLAREFRHYLRGAPEIRIDETGLRLFYPSHLFWPWSRIKDARATDAQVIAALHRSGHIDQGVRDRTEVPLKTPPLDLPTKEIVRLLEAGVRRFGET